MEPLSSIQVLEKIAGYTDLGSEEFDHILSVTALRNEEGEITGFELSKESTAIPKTLWEKVKAVIWKIISFFFCASPSVDGLKDLYEVYSQIAAEVKEIPDAQKKAVEDSINNLKAFYQKYQASSDVKRVADCMDILDVVGLAVQKGGLNETLGTAVERVDAPANPGLMEKISARLIPVVKVEKLDGFFKVWDEQFPDGQIPSLKEIAENEELKSFLWWEEVAMHRIVDWMYRNRFLGKLLNNSLVSWAVTKFMEKRCNQQLEPCEASTKTLLTFFKQLGIQAGTEHKGKLYSYREMFGHSLREEKSCNAAFQRSLTEEARKMFLEGSEEDSVVTLAHSRIRILHIEKGGAETPYTIDGKQLSEKVRNAFSMKNILGYESKANLKQAKSAEDKFCWGLIRAVDKESWKMLVSRLAPSDIHECVHPMAGRILSCREACEKLLEICKDDVGLCQQLEQAKEGLSEDQVIIGIRGTKQSVSTAATRHANPLGQNNRQFIVTEVDGKLAIHFFIGAISVDNVRVEAEPGKVEAGKWLCVMGPGLQSDRGENQWKNPVKPGSPFHKFGMDGSTCVTLMPESLIDPQGAFKDLNRLRYRDPNGEERQIEIQTPVGQVLGNISRKK